MKHVIVSGGSRGLGLAIVKHLLEEGYMVSTCSRAKTSEIDQLTSQYPYFQWFQAEIGNAAQTALFVKQACDWAKETQLWAIINNAGIAKEGILATFPNIESDTLLQVNLHGALYLAREALRVFLRQNSAGRIINISSIIGSRGYTGLAAYSASKAGLDGLTRALARENGRRNITINSIAPGYLDTEMSSILSDKKRDQIIRRTPMHRLGTVEDITPAISFLLSDGAAFITGQTLTIDGGITT
ncbi:short-chain dehydrogenase [Shewanella morhuae]|uniref:3-oxoacyl-[acyl-carrier-protein] reductase FabG n=1 Tax=Shewanella morhuae TaxID=365591 RepID=A0A380A9K4_9GAMM|nr:SDR family oxidoreductase [Shewanella morhuae]PTA50814.1 short-chain dehydrogenase [Shewanella morhuae]SUI76001.1 3-oxoacyl-[acyl-carrier-protein] reductase FabG [Shewanella morhuae]